MKERVLEGFLAADKPEGPTSHDVVTEARRALGMRRVGHTGTLDPFASGLLLLCVGRATRLAQYVSGLDKTYRATLKLGISTDSHDRDGAVVATSERWRELGAAELDEALAGFRGEVDQIPPRLSAKKVGGEAAHRRVRRGEAVALEPSRVVVHELRVTAFAPPEVRLLVRCSSGTYVRGLARDLGDALGTGAHLVSLRRTRIGGFDVEDAIRPDRFGDPDAVRHAWIEPLEALGHLPRLDVSDDDAQGLRHGRAVPTGLTDQGVVVAAHAGALVAVGRVRDARFRPRKVFASG